jgi:ribulose-bisphosphate carboxylase large chain
LGLTPEDFAQIAGEAWMGGLDIAKDDEMLVDPAYSPLHERIQACAHTAEKIKNKTGKPCLMLANISDEMDRLPERYQEAKSAGAHAVMLNPFFTGFSSVRSIREKSELPIMGHFTGMALYDRIPNFGIEGKVLVKLQRILGCDMIGLPGFGDRMHNTNQTVLENIKACLMPLGKIKASLPIPGGSDWAGTLPSLYENIGHTDFGFISGRGVFAHPDGPKSGAQSLADAWDCIKHGLSLAEGAKTRPALTKALEAFGK